MTAILTLNTIAHTVGALGVGTQVEAIHDGQYAMAVASALLTIGVLLFSEILPKTLGTLYWKSLCVPSAYMLRVHDTESVDLALDILLDRREQIMVVKDEFGTTRGLLSMEDIIETLLGVEIVDEADLDAIEEGTTAEDLREFAKEKFGHTNDENEQQNGE